MSALSQASSQATDHNQVDSVNDRYSNPSFRLSSLYRSQALYEGYNFKDLRLVSRGLKTSVGDLDAINFQKFSEYQLADALRTVKSMVFREKIEHAVMMFFEGSLAGEDSADGLPKYSYPYPSDPGYYCRTGSRSGFTATRFILVAKAQDHLESKRVQDIAKRVVIGTSIHEKNAVTMYLNSQTGMVELCFEGTQKPFLEMSVKDQSRLVQAASKLMSQPFKTYYDPKTNTRFMLDTYITRNGKSLGMFDNPMRPFSIALDGPATVKTHRHCTSFIQHIPIESPLLPKPQSLRDEGYTFNFNGNEYTSTGIHSFVEEREKETTFFEQEDSDILAAIEQIYAQMPNKIWKDQSHDWTLFFVDETFTSSVSVPSKPWSINEPYEVETQFEGEYDEEEGWYKPGFQSTVFKELKLPIGEYDLFPHYKMPKTPLIVLAKSKLPPHSKICDACNERSEFSPRHKVGEFGSEPVQLVSLYQSRANTMILVPNRSHGFFHELDPKTQVALVKSASKATATSYRQFENPDSNSRYVSDHSLFSKTPLTDHMDNKLIQAPFAISLCDPHAIVTTEKELVKLK